MQLTTPTRRRYHPAIRNAIVRTGKLNLFPECDIPESTGRSWLKRGSVKVVALDHDDDVVADLHAQVARLQGRLARVLVVLRLLVVMMRTLGVALNNERLPIGKDKERMLRAIDKASDMLPKRQILTLIGMTESRLARWRTRQLNCALDDRASCPKTVPSRLTRDEVNGICEMAAAEEYRHISIRSLALLAQRLGKVFASASTWGKVIREHDVRRPRKCLYPPKPRVGLRASHSNEWWHIDVSVIRLLDGTRTYLHGIVDNASRRVLAWALEPKLCAESTRRMLVEALQSIGQLEVPISVMTDGGSENLVVGEENMTDIVRHIIAQVDVQFSNSMVEAFWNQLRHQWLYLHRLDTFTGLEKLIATYVEQHNSVIPRVQLDERTPDEVYFGKNEDLAEQLAQERALVREQRMEANRNASCGSCPFEAGDQVGPKTDDGSVR